MERAVIETPAGFVGVTWSGAGLVSLSLPANTPHQAEEAAYATLKSIRVKPGRSAGGEAAASFDINWLESEIRSYYSGQPVNLSFPVDWSLYTDFQARVLKRVSAIPWGQVVSYGDIAGQIGNPRAPRAVGGAVGSNRVLLVVPCHRVVAHDHTIGGFGCGLDWKRRLLSLEGISI